MHARNPSTVKRRHIGSLVQPTQLQVNLETLSQENKAESDNMTSSVFLGPLHMHIWVRKPFSPPIHKDGYHLLYSKCLPHIVTVSSQNKKKISNTTSKLDKCKIVI